MGHSIRDYLERRSTAELQTILGSLSHDPEYEYFIELLKEFLKECLETENKQDAKSLPLGGEGGPLAVDEV